MRFRTLTIALTIKDITILMSISIIPSVFFVGSHGFSDELIVAPRVLPGSGFDTMWTLGQAPFRASLATQRSSTGSIGDERCQIRCHANF